MLIASCDVRRTRQNEGNIRDNVGHIFSSSWHENSSKCIWKVVVSQQI